METFVINGNLQQTYPQKRLFNYMEIYIFA